jgi:hypothetical protein
MRAVGCPCGEHLEARNDGELIKAAKEHADEDHPNEYSEGDLRLLVIRRHTTRVEHVRRGTAAGSESCVR